MKKQNLKEYEEKLVDSQEKRYNKWRVFSSYIGTILILSFVLEWLIVVILTLIKGKMLNINPIIYIITYIILLFIFFLTIGPYQQILDCKNNTFIKYKAVCIESGCSGKGVGLYHVFKILERENKEVKFSVDKYLFKKGDIVIVIIGLRSRQVIEAHRYID